MDMDKARKIITLAAGLKRYEWAIIAGRIDRVFQEASARIELTQADAERIESLVELDAKE